MEDHNLIEIEKGFSKKFNLSGHCEKILKYFLYSYVEIQLSIVIPPYPRDHDLPILNIEDFFKKMTKNFQ